MFETIKKFTFYSKEKIEMKLITEEIRATTPFLYETENVSILEKKATAKFFTPYSNFTWYLFELDQDNDLAYGLVFGYEDEWGRFNISKLEEITIGGGLPAVERDLFFRPLTVEEIYQERGIPLPSWIARKKEEMG